MFEQILQSISRFVTLDSHEQDFFVSKLEFRKYRKKETVLQEGNVCNHIFFINKGCIRYYYTVEGKENTAQFFFENGWYTDFDSFLSGKPSRLNIQTLERTEMLLLSAKNLHEIYNEVPKFERLGRQMAENAFLGVRQRNEMLENLTVEERYLALMKERPKVFERIPQHYIASYLGVQPESLSRIRKRIFVK
jgi:CRP-like cAMP-binding protein